MTKKENLELINIRNRISRQREEIRRLTAENYTLKKKIEELRSGKSQDQRSGKAPWSI